MLSTCGRAWNRKTHPICAEGAKHENAPRLGAFSCSAHVEGPVTQKPPEKWVVFVFNVSISVNK